MWGMSVKIEQQWQSIVAQWRAIVNAKLKSESVSRSELARRVEVSPQNVTDYLNGHKSPSPKMMDRFLEALELEPTIAPQEAETVDA